MVNYDQQQKIITLAIDLKYKDVVNQQLIDKLTQILLVISKQDVKISYQFFEEPVQEQEVNLINNNVQQQTVSQLQNMADNNDSLHCEITQFTNDDWIKLLLIMRKILVIYFLFLKTQN